MNKRRLWQSILAAIISVVVVFGCAALAACDNSPAQATYTVTFDVQGHGTAQATQTVEKGKYATAPADLTEEGWTFGGWYKESDCTNKFDFKNEAIMKNTTVYAKWTEKQIPDSETYTVMFDVQGHGTAPDSQTIEDGKYATDPGDLTEEGWTFGGWYKETECTNEFVFDSEVITADTTVYAKWTEQQIPDSETYTVTFDVQGHGTAPAVQTIEKGQYAAKPTDLTAEGWTFGGWYKEAACTNEYVFASEAVLKNITVYAKWTENKPSVSSTTIYLAGDSTVQGYGDTQYIAGWGQYLNLFLDEEVTVVNCARGGRSSRSFLNEGRLYTGSYKFSENGGKSIQETINVGDYLLIQFGHNDDDTKKQSSYSSLYNRMVPLGTPDSRGIYPVTAPSGKQATTYLPAEYLNGTGIKQSDIDAAYTEIAKYGSEYYAYDCGGTYKWFLKQYVDFARSVGAVPVLITPVARVSFNSDGTLRSGPGLHGTDFAYVKAVRQLAEEEDCLLIDLFADTKDIIETATSDYAKFLMAHVPNSLTGAWPTGYDNSYQNSDTGWTGMESTHYNKYGAFISAAKVAEHILESSDKNETHNGGKEYYAFTEYVKTTPSYYLDPSNLISKAKITKIENLFKSVSVTNPDRTYPDPAEVVAAINKACSGTVTEDNYLEYQIACEEVSALYYNLNIDDRSKVTNYSKLQSYIEAVKQQIEDHRDKPSLTAMFEVSSLAAGAITDTKTVSINEKYGEGAKDKTPGTNTGNTVDFKIVGTSDKAVTVTEGKSSFTYNGENYSVTKYLSMGGSASFGTSRYIEFTTTAKCRIIVASMSTSKTDDRTLNLVNAENTSQIIKSFNAPKSNDGIGVDYIDTEEAGTYMLGSGGSGIYVYGIIIEVVNHTHSWYPKFNYNGISHWHVCTVCGAKSEEQAHDWENGACNICGLKDLSNTDVWETVETTFDYAAAVEKYGTETATTAEAAIGKFTVGAGVYFRADNINTQKRDVTVTLDGVTNTICFEGSGQSNTAITQFTLWKGDVNVTPAGWATESKDRREYKIENLEAGTYTIRTSASGAIYGLTVTEIVEKTA